MFGAGSEGACVFIWLVGVLLLVLLSSCASSGKQMQAAAFFFGGAVMELASVSLLVCHLCCPEQCYDEASLGGIIARPMQAW